MSGNIDDQTLRSKADVWYLKRISFHGKQVPIITQNFNGPCSFIAICNILILRGNITIEPPTRHTVSYEFLSQLVAEYLLIRSPNVDISASLSIMPHTQKGLDLNPVFTSPTSFRAATQTAGGELALFAQVGIDLVHGWLVDPESDEACAMKEEAAEDYDTAVGLIAEADHVAGGLLVPDYGNVEGQRQDMDRRQEDWTDVDRRKIRNALTIRHFLEQTQSQLTYHGLFHLASTLPAGTLVALFRSSHLSVLYKSGHSGNEGTKATATDGDWQVLDDTHPDTLAKTTPDSPDSPSAVKVAANSEGGERPPSHESTPASTEDESLPSSLAPQSQEETKTLPAPPSPNPNTNTTTSSSSPPPTTSNYPSPPPSSSPESTTPQTQTPSTSPPPPSLTPNTSTACPTTTTTTTAHPTTHNNNPSPNSNSHIYTLTTDHVFLHEPSVVWERIEDVDGAAGVFVDSSFTRGVPAGGDWARSSGGGGTQQQHEGGPIQGGDGMSDAELARHLQAEEEHYAMRAYRRRQQQEEQEQEQERRARYLEEEERRQKELHVRRAKGRRWGGGEEGEGRKRDCVIM